jgi:hypothetical protein
LGKLDTGTLIDAVPLDEVSEIHIMQEGSSNPANQVEKGSSSLDMGSFENSQNNINTKVSQTHQATMRMPRITRKTLESSKTLSGIRSNDGPSAPLGKGLGPVMLIITDENGYNSGRKYYFQTKSDADRREIVEVLAARSKAARTSKEAKGRLQKIRERVSVVTKSDMFQYFFAFLIIMVIPCRNVFPIFLIA